MKLKDLTGKKINRLTVIKRVDNSRWNETRWLCKCDCGKEVIATYGKIAYGHTKSCGCLAKDIFVKNVTKHKLRNTRLYNIWANMKQRCNNPNQKAYKYYGARGIKVCDEWLNSFENFYHWAIKNGYEKHLQKFGNKNTTIDRIDVNGNYEPSNCKWSTQKEQSLNKTNNHLIKYNNEEHTISEWAIIKNLTKSTIYHRLQRGWSVEKTLTTPLKK